MAKPVGVHKGIGNILFIMLMLTGSCKNNTTTLKMKTLCSFGFSKQCTFQAQIQHMTMKTEMHHSANEPSDFYNTLGLVITLLSVTFLPSSFSECLLSFQVQSRNCTF